MKVSKNIKGIITFPTVKTQNEATKYTIRLLVDDENKKLIEKLIEDTPDIKVNKFKDTIKLKPLLIHDLSMFDENCNNEELEHKNKMEKANFITQQYVDQGYAHFINVSFIPEYFELLSLYGESLDFNNLKNNDLVILPNATAYKVITKEQTSFIGIGSFGMTLLQSNALVIDIPKNENKELEDEIAKYKKLAEANGNIEL